MSLPEGPITLAEAKAMTAAANNGQLRIEPDSADRCIRACENYVERIRSNIQQAQHSVRIESFGTLQMGRSLGKMFYDLTIGGDNSLTATMVNTVEIYGEAIEALKTAKANYIAIDEQNAGGLNSIGTNL
ncbi:MAG: hypothetical protein GX542_02280 [Rhodococcus sp.]|nr:hypothetical protein [Rhodococcus sp. (in: high G+C Gram-positive bacteria)]